jgi:hypothetical protein
MGYGSDQMPGLPSSEWQLASMDREITAIPEVFLDEGQRVP